MWCNMEPESVTIGQETINLALKRLNLILEQVNLDNFLEFITFNGIYEPDFKYWNIIPELWSDWLEK